MNDSRSCNIFPVLMFAAGIRWGSAILSASSFAPMSSEHHWGARFFLRHCRSEPGLGRFATFAGLLADRWGAKRVLWIGGAPTPLGLAGMAPVTSATGLTASAGWFWPCPECDHLQRRLLGSRAAGSRARRSWAMGLVAAAGSFRVFHGSRRLGIDLGPGLVRHLVRFSAASFLDSSFGSALAGNLLPAACASGQTAAQAVRQAFADRSFIPLTAGSSVCGFQVVFIGVHLPTYLLDKGLSGNVGMTALALIGLFNIAGTGVGVLGTRYPKRFPLAGIICPSSAVIAAFLLLPLTPLSVYGFAACRASCGCPRCPPPMPSSPRSTACAIWACSRAWSSSATRLVVFSGLAGREAV